MAAAHRTLCLYIFDSYHDIRYSGPQKKNLRTSTAGTQTTVHARGEHTQCGNGSPLEPDLTSGAKPREITYSVRNKIPVTESNPACLLTRVRPDGQSLRMPRESSGKLGSAVGTVIDGGSIFLSKNQLMIFLGIVGGGVLERQSWV